MCRKSHLHHVYTIYTALKNKAFWGYFCRKCRCAVDGLNLHFKNLNNSFKLMPYLAVYQYIYICVDSVDSSGEKEGKEGVWRSLQSTSTLTPSAVRPIC